jgi:hypothetical protein
MFASEARLGGRTARSRIRIGGAAAAESCNAPSSEPVPPRLARNTIIESTFEVGRRFRSSMRVDCGQPDPAAVIGRNPVNGTRACPSASTRRSSRIGAPVATPFISFAALTIGTRLAVADA